MIASDILEKQNTIEWLPVNKIGIDRTYQRAAGQSKIKAISSNFNEISAGVLIVSVRNDGRMVVVDGQHRLESMKKLKIEFARCQVCRGLTVEQEAEIYRYCNTVRKTPMALDVFRARLVEKEPIAIAITNVVEKCGLSIQFRGSKHYHSSKSIWAVGALEEIYKHGQEKLLEEILILAIHSWPDEGNAFEAKVLLGIDRFLVKYRGQYNREEFIIKMNTTGLDSLRRHARYHIESGNLHERQAFAKALQEAYDKNRRTRRLESRD